MGVIEDVASIKHELEEVKKENKEENKKIQELSRIKKANKKLLEALVISIFAFIILLIYTLIIINYWQMLFI